MEARKASAPQAQDLTPKRPAADASFDPYGRLLRMLMPSVRQILVHDGYANLVWSSDEADPHELTDIVKETIANALTDASEFAGTMRTLDADRCVYAFAVRGTHTDLLGVVSLIAQLSGTQTDARTCNYVRRLVQPALECLGRELALRSELGSRAITESKHAMASC